MTKKLYAGIGNPDTPYTTLSQITQLATRLEGLGYTLRTDGGQGGSEAFNKGSVEKEIIVPWKKFNGQDTPFCKNLPEATEIARKFAPAFDTLKESIQAIIASKVHLILGPDLQSPVEFVICWSADGLEAGGKRTAKSGFIGTPITIADNYNIPIFNLKNADAMDRLKQLLSV